ncbi:MAG TPA: hypothetical protein VHF05_03525 [Candidatus Paceibacterota bacterium]|jgi:hypothetical protein|nr:hypothetical protein [Candidatus Paceibacterota bacterium]
MRQLREKHVALSDEQLTALIAARRVASARCLYPSREVVHIPSLVETNRGLRKSIQVTLDYPHKAQSCFAIDLRPLEAGGRKIWVPDHMAEIFHVDMGAAQTKEIEYDFSTEHPQEPYEYVPAMKEKSPS